MESFSFSGKGNFLQNKLLAFINEMTIFYIPVHKPLLHVSPFALKFLRTSSLYFLLLGEMLLFLWGKGHLVRNNTIYRTIIIASFFHYLHIVVFIFVAEIVFTAAQQQTRVSSWYQHTPERKKHYNGFITLVCNYSANV